MTRASLLNELVEFFATIGAYAIGALAAIGRLARFTGTAINRAFRPPYYPTRLFEQMLTIGYFSLPVVGLTAFFTGGALALQIYLGSSRFNAESFVAPIVALGI